jgi:hypothetical protein
MHPIAKPPRLPAGLRLLPASPPMPASPLPANLALDLGKLAAVTAADEQ